jgi:hypothetical protein
MRIANGGQKKGPGKTGAFDSSKTLIDQRE